jgi:hypothetical protein
MPPSSREEGLPFFRGSCKQPLLPKRHLTDCLEPCLLESSGRLYPTKDLFCSLPKPVALSIARVTHRSISDPYFPS